MTPHEAVARPVFLARIRRLAARIHSCQRVPGRDRKDVAQQIVLVVLQRASKFDPTRGTAEAFVMTAARSAAQSILRDAGRAKRDPGRVQPLADAAALPAPEDLADHRDELQVRVGRAVGLMDGADADVARDLQRFGPNNARTRLGSNRSQWVQTKERIRLTLEEENILDSSEKRRKARTGRRI